MPDATLTSDVRMKTCLMLDTHFCFHKRFVFILKPFGTGKIKITPDIAKLFEKKLVMSEKVSSLFFRQIVSSEGLFFWLLRTVFLRSVPLRLRYATPPLHSATENFSQQPKKNPLMTQFPKK